MRDWTKAFRRASFKGARFWVDDENQDGGRRVAVQHVAYGERPITEDFGSVETGFSVTAYVASDAADAEARLLTAALASSGPGPLVLPMEGLVQAHLTDFGRSRSKDRSGYIAFDLSFLRVGDPVAFLPSFNVNGALGALDKLASTLVSAFSR